MKNRDEIKRQMHECFMRKTLADIGKELVRDFTAKRNLEDQQRNFKDPNSRMISYA